MNLSEIVKRAIELGRPSGTITFEQLNDLVGGRTAEPEEVECLIQALSEQDINVVET